MFGLQAFVGWTRLGRAMRAIPGPRGGLDHGRRPERRDRPDVPARRGLAAAAGVVWDLHYVRQDLGFASGLKAFTAAVLGGIGNITGAVLGGFIIGFVENFASANGLARWSSSRCLSS